MSALETILNELKNSESDEEYNIPFCWNYNKCEFEKAEKTGEIIVNPVNFFCHSLEYINSQNEKFSGSLTVYSMFIRTFTAWNHGQGLENGTLLKSLAILPIIKNMGFNCISLLPVFQLSYKNLKGELPSPYSVKNILKIEPSLADRHISADAELQFKAFCEGAHKLGLKIILDFVFRTASRDCDLIDEHPDWFYWVNTSSLDDFKSPDCPDLPHVAVNTKNVKQLYKSDSMGHFAESFAYPPKKENFPDEDLIEGAKKKLGISIMPGFADTINDPQPPWTDITFLKFYMDNTEKAREKFGEDFPPMIAQDGVKSSIFQGTIKNNGLWDYTESIIPYYIDEFSIDGARLDMAHALPVELCNRIISKIKSKNKDFILWSEEFESGNSSELKDEGYTFFTGGIWDLWDKKSFSSMSFNKRIAECVDVSLPVMSSSELSDSLRSMMKIGLIKTITSIFITALLPNTVFVCANGLEMGEKQPMNLGLRCNEKDRFVLPKNHKYYGKLAYFDFYEFNWLNRKHIYEAMCVALKIRKRYSSVISDIKNFDLKQLRNSSNITVICGYNGKEGFLLVANRENEEIKVYLKKLIPENTCLGECIHGSDSHDLLYPNSVIVYEIKSAK